MFWQGSLSFREARFEKLEIEKLHFGAGSFVLELLALTLKTTCLELLRSFILELLEGAYLGIFNTCCSKLKAAAAGATFLTQA